MGSVSKPAENKQEQDDVNRLGAVANTGERQAGREVEGKLKGREPSEIPEKMS